MKKTLLEMVQSIMSSMDSDEVNSISDTVESLQVAGYIRDSYYEIVSGLNLPNTFDLFQLDASSDNTKPTVMYLPSKAANIRWIKYNKQMLLSSNGIQAEPPGFYTRANGNGSYNYDTTQPIVTNPALGPPDFEEVFFLDLEEFLRRMYVVGSNTAADSVNDVGSFTLKTISSEEITIFFRNDRSPKYWTTFDDNTILFDSYDASVDSTLQKQKTTCWGEIIQTWSMVDNFIPSGLSDKEFTLLENEAKQQAFIEAKQSTNPLATARAHKGWVRARREKHRVPYSENSRQHTTTNFGRAAWPATNSRNYRNNEEN